jgi:hypothetical protein
MKAKTEIIKQAVDEWHGPILDKLLNEYHETVRHRLMVEPHYAGAAVWFYDGKFTLEPVFKYGLQLLPDHPGQPLVVFSPGEYLELSRTEILERIKSALVARVLENITK